jgi:hypothetical protein
MSKSIKKKPAKEASNIFHNIMAASVKGNPKPKKKPAIKSKNIEVNELIIKAVVNQKSPNKK